MTSGPFTSWEIDGETVETVSDFIFVSSKITADGDCSHEIKRCLLFGKKVMTNLDSIFKSRDITLPTKVHLVRTMVFPVVMYGCESWTVKKAAAAAATKSLQSCPTLCNPAKGSPPGSPVPGILQARILEWVNMSFSRRKLSAEELMLLNCGVGEDSRESLDCEKIQPVHPKGDQSWVFIGRTDVEAETPILWPPHAKSWLIELTQRP